MRVALLINDRESRQWLAGSVESGGVKVDQYATAEKALGMFEATRFDLVVLHWQVHPGLKPSDPELRDLAAMIPTVSMNRNVLYWQAALRVIDALRAEGSPNQEVPIVIVFPDLGKARFGAGDRLSRDAVESDLESRRPVTTVIETSRDRLADTVIRKLGKADA